MKLSACATDEGNDSVPECFALMGNNSTGLVTRHAPKSSAARELCFHCKIPTGNEERSISRSTYKSSGTQSDNKGYNKSMLRNEGTSPWQTFYPPCFHPRILPGIGVLRHLVGFLGVGGNTALGTVDTQGCCRPRASFTSNLLGSLAHPEYLPELTAVSSNILCPENIDQIRSTAFCRPVTP